MTKIKRRQGVYRRKLYYISMIQFACMAIRLLWLQPTYANPIACMGFFWSAPLGAEPAYAKNRVEGR